jgi:peptide/nickel transport system permease protein
MSKFFRRNKLAFIGLVILTCLTLVALFSPWILPYDPSGQDLAARLRAPTWEHPFGNDELGRDILSRVLLGTRISMRVGAMVVLLSGIFGVLIGGFAGYVGGYVDTFVTVIVVNSLMAFPGILLAIALVAFLGPGIDRLIFALSVVGLAGYARLARGQVLKVKTLEFVEAARAIGASGPRIFFFHVLPSIVQPILVQASIGMAADFVGGIHLSGLGIAPAPSWARCSTTGAGIFRCAHGFVPVGGTGINGSVFQL